MAQETETIIMGRIREEIDVDGRKCWTLFDSGARHSYVTREAAQGLSWIRCETRNATIAGIKRKTSDACIVPAVVEGHSLEFQAAVVDEIGRDEDGRAIDVLFGELARKQWGIRYDLENEKLDFTHYSRVFVEY